MTKHSALDRSFYASWQSKHRKFVVNEKPIAVSRRGTDAANLKMSIINVKVQLTIIMYIYHAFINALNDHMIHINLTTIFYTHVEHNTTKTVCNFRQIMSIHRACVLFLVNSNAKKILFITFGKPKTESRETPLNKTFLELAAIRVSLTLINPIWTVRKSTTKHTNARVLPKFTQSIRSDIRLWRSRSKSRTIPPTS